MIEFWQALWNPDLAFLRYALGAGLLASIAFGVIGTYVVARRITYIAGAIAHCVLGGIGAGLYLKTVCGWTWCDPMYGAVAAALAAPSSSAGEPVRPATRRHGHQRPVGGRHGRGPVIFRQDPGVRRPHELPVRQHPPDFAKRSLAGGGAGRPGRGPGDSFLQPVSGRLLRRGIRRLRGVPRKVFYLLLLCLTALTVVLLVRVVGIVMVIALLTLPAAVAEYFSRRLWQMIVLSALSLHGLHGPGPGRELHPQLAQRPDHYPAGRRRIPAGHFPEPLLEKSG